MSHNRPKLVTDAIDSILAQSYANFELIVSDNSSNSETEEILRNYQDHPKLKIQRRQPSVPVFAHFNQVLSEVRAPYFMMFHDDDIMVPGALARVAEAIRQNEKWVAIASTAFKMENNLKTKKQLNKHNWKSDLIIGDARELASHYIDSRMGIAAFPSYTYRTEAIKNISFDQTEAGKYSDVTFLLKLAARGPILWLRQPLLYYRIHDKNDSKYIEINNLRLLVRFLRKQVGLTAKDLQEFRVKSYYIWSQSSTQGKKRSLIRKITLSYYLKNPMGLFLFFFDKLT